MNEYKKKTLLLSFLFSSAENFVQGLTLDDFAGPAILTVCPGFDSWLNEFGKYIFLSFGCTG